jgi:hypothetical protein
MRNKKPKIKMRGRKLMVNFIHTSRTHLKFLRRAIKQLDALGQVNLQSRAKGRKLET